MVGSRPLAAHPGPEIAQKAGNHEYKKLTNQSHVPFLLCIKMVKLHVVSIEILHAAPEAFPLDWTRHIASGVGCDLLMIACYSWKHTLKIPSAIWCFLEVVAWDLEASSQPKDAKRHGSFEGMPTTGGGKLPKLLAIFEAIFEAQKGHLKQFLRPRNAIWSNFWGPETPFEATFGVQKARLEAKSVPSRRLRRRYSLLALYSRSIL